jgi:Predicted oxidoreductases (related to aryl-alcohol dehydrogenases)
LDEAANQGIRLLDTADAYGDAIDLIGDYHRSRNFNFGILSKFKKECVGSLRKTLEMSLSKLNVPRLNVYSFHSAQDFFNFPSITDELFRLKQDGLIEKLVFPFIQTKSWSG